MNVKILSLVGAIAWCVAVNASQDTSKVLVTMDGKPFITEQQFNQDLDRYSKAFSFSSKDSQEKKDKFLEIMVRQAVINKYVHDNKLDTSSAYQQELREYDSEVDKSQIQTPIETWKWYLNNILFEQQVPAPLGASDAEIQKYYNERKEDFDLPPFEQVKEKLRPVVDQKNHDDKVNAEIERLKKEYKIVVVK